MQALGAYGNLGLNRGKPKFLLHIPPALEALAEVATALGDTPAVFLTGPRQCGKTSLARELLPEDSPNYFDAPERLGQPIPPGPRFYP